jgi:hypothetical protein
MIPHVSYQNKTKQNLVIVSAPIILFQFFVYSFLKQIEKKSKRHYNNINNKQVIHRTDDDKIIVTSGKNQTNNKYWMTVHNPSGFVQFDDESRDDLFISNTSDTIRSCYMLNLGFSLVDDFAFNANANNKDNSRTEIVDEDNNNDDDYDETPLKVAIQTARIFNGIIVGNHGTLLKQNNRADPDKLGTIVKEGQSRQALQIEQIIAAATNKNDDYGYADDDTNKNLDDDHRNSNTTAAVNNDDKEVNDDHGK